MMRSVHFTRYGTPDNVAIIDIPLPEPAENEVLIKIKAASLNATDIELLRGDAIIRLGNGFRRPRNTRLGCDLSGVIEAVGKEVPDYVIGDEVYLDVMYQKSAYGSLAEYITAPHTRLRRKTGHMSFEEAATIPQAGVLAAQGIIEPRPPTSSDHVLINGAGGGVGSFAIQIAKFYGAEITAVDHPYKFDFMTSLGADHVISYLDTDFTRLATKFDIILDVIARKSVRAHLRALQPNGRYRMVGGSLIRILGTAIWGTLVSKFSSKSVGILLGRPNDKEMMDFIVDLYDKGQLTPQIDQVYPLDQIREALWEVEQGNVKGKVVIAMK